MNVENSNLKEEQNIKKKNNKLLVIVSSIIVSLIMIVTIVFFVSINVRSSNQEKALLEQLDLGNKYLSEMDYEQAIVAYEAAVEIDPMSVEAYLGLASVYEAQGEYEKAISILQEGFDRTGNKILLEELERIKQIQDNLINSSQNTTTEKIIIGGIKSEIPGKVVDGVYHNPYYEFVMSQEYEEYLNMLVEMLDNGQYEDAISALDIAMIDNILNELPAIEYNDGKYINLILGDRKIHLSANIGYMHEYYVVILPIDSGTGYMISMDINNDYYEVMADCLYGECKSGVFWGEYNVEHYTTSYLCSSKGNVGNGLMDGLWYEYDINYEGIHTAQHFKMGKMYYQDLAECSCGCGGMQYYLDLSEIGGSGQLFTHMTIDLERLEKEYCAINWYGIPNKEYSEIDGGYRYYLW